MFILLEQLFNWTTLRPLLVSGTLFYLVYHVFRKLLSFYSFAQIINKIPGPEVSWSPLGHLYMFRPTGKMDRVAGFYNSVSELAKAYSPKYSLFRLWFTVRPVIVIFKADSAEKILSSNVHIQKGHRYKLITPWLGTGLLTSSGLPTEGNLEKYQKHRDLFDKFLYSKKFNDFLESIGYSRYPKDTLMPEGQLLTIYGYPEEINYPEAREQKALFNLEVFNRIEQRELDELEKLVPVEFLSNSLDGRYSGKLIYVSMGSMGAVDLGLMMRLVAVLGKTNHKYIVSKGPRHSEYELPMNMFGGRYLPQVSLIPHVDLVITHGGCNTVTEVFAEGKPMIVLPLFTYQFDNAQRLQETGYGLRLDTYNFTDEQLINGIDELLYDQQLVQKLKKASKRISLVNRHQQLANKFEELLITN